MNPEKGGCPGFLASRQTTHEPGKRWVSWLPGFKKDGQGRWVSWLQEGRWVSWLHHGFKKDGGCPGFILASSWLRGRRIRNEEELPVYDQLGDKRSLLVARANIAVIKMKRLEPDDLDDAEEYLNLALTPAQEMGLPEAEIIESLINQVRQQKKNEA